MIGIVATLRVQPDKIELFEKIFAQLTAKVKANEPGALTYQLTRSRNEPTTYKCLELYRDQAAVDHHVTTDHFKAAMRDLAAVLSSDLEPEFLDAVG
jgi:quinol monooxygenase YgiN